MKHVLEESGESGAVSNTLPGMYRSVATHLGLAPDQQSETEFRRLLGGVTTIVEATAAIRNRFGDAHGRGPADATADAHHAELSVNVAGSAASFILQRWVRQRES